MNESNISEQQRTVPVTHEQRPGNAYRLSPRVIECLHYTSKGYSAKEVADIVGVSKCTVENDLAHARKRLDASTGTEACCIAIRKGLIA